MHGVGALIKQYDQNISHRALRIRQTRCDRLECDSRRFFHRIAVHARADGGEADGLDAMLFGQLQALAIAVRQVLGCIVLSVSIDRTNGVKNVLRRKRAGSRDYRAASWATTRTRTNSIQLVHDVRPARAMNRPIHSASAAQARVRGVDDSVHPDLGDVADNQPELLPVGEIDLHVANRTANGIVKVETVKRAGAF